MTTKPPLKVGDPVIVFRYTLARTVITDPGQPGTVVTVGRTLYTIRYGAYDTEIKVRMDSWIETGSFPTQRIATTATIAEDARAETATARLGKAGVELRPHAARKFTVGLLEELVAVIEKHEAGTAIAAGIQRTKEDTR